MPASPYNIAHVLPWTAIGGTEHATLRIAQATAGAQFRHVMFYRRIAPVVGDFFAAAGYETFAYDQIMPSYRRVRAYWRSSDLLADEFKEREIDLVHCADVAGAFSAGLAGRLARLPVLCHVRNRHGQMSRRDQAFLRLVNKFAFVSADTWRHFAYRVGPRRGIVIYDGIDVQVAPPAARAVRQEFGLSDDVKLIVMVARIAPQKDFMTLARAAKRVVAKRPDVRFLIVGDHAQTAEHRGHYAEVQQALADNKVAPYFVFTGFRADVARMLSASDIFVLCTHFEGLPLVILEAMAHGLPVVATAVDGIPEIVRDGRTGLLHQHEDAAQLATQLLSLLQDDARAARLGTAAREFVKIEWSRERFAADMTALYRSLLDDGAQATALSVKGALLKQ